MGNVWKNPQAVAFYAKDGSILCPLCADLEKDSIIPIYPGEEFEEYPECSKCERVIDEVHLYSDEPEGPDEGDLYTEDYRNVYEFGSLKHKPVLTIEWEDNFDSKVKEYMEQTKFYPSVWSLSDHGNWHLLQLK